MKYEDLVTNPVPTLIDLYEKLQIPIDYKALKLAIDYIKKPIPDFVIKNKKVDTNMNLLRGKGHNAETWKADLNIASVKYIEHSCKLAMKVYGYNKSI